MTATEKDLSKNIFVFNHETRTNKPNMLRKYLPVPLYKGKVKLHNITKLYDLFEITPTIKIKSNLSLNPDKDLFVINKNECEHPYTYETKDAKTKTVEYIDLCFFDQNNKPIDLPFDFYITLYYVEETLKQPIFYITDEEYKKYL